MKTLKQIESEYNDVLSINRYTLSDAELRQAQKKAALLRQCKAYLERSPSRYYLEKTKEELELRVKKIESSYHQWVSCLPNQMKAGKKPNELLSMFLKEMELSKHRAHLKAASYLLAA